MTLLERRAKFVYDGARLAAQAANAPIVPVPWDEREAPFKEQFLKVIERQCGEQRSRSPEELHGSWMQAYFLMGWVYGPKYDREKKIHPDLVPYADLGQLERDKDAVFVALCEIARQWIYDMPETPEDRLGNNDPSFAELIKAKDQRIGELKRKLAIAEGADTCESCGVLLKPEDGRHNWADGVVTCLKCGGPTDEEKKPCTGCSPSSAVSERDVV